MLNRSSKYKYKISKYKSDIPKPKRNEIVIIPSDNRLMEIPPYLGSEKLPYWWKDLPRSSKFSLRRCQGTYDFAQYGFIIPLWTDLTIRPTINGQDFEFKTTSFDNNPESFRVDPFRNDSAEGCPFGDDRIIKTSGYPKIVSPWRFYTEKGTSLIALPVLHEPNPNYMVMPGMVHTDFYNQIHIVIKVLTDKEFTIPAGTAMQHMIPIKRNNNFKRIVWGNDSMYRFITGTGMGEGCLSVEDDSRLYHKIQKNIDLEIEQRKNKKWYSLRK